MVAPGNQKNSHGTDEVMVIYLACTTVRGGQQRNVSRWRSIAPSAVLRLRGARSPNRGPTMSSIFISYRRDETKDVAGRLYDRLTTIFGKDKVFRDIYTIPAGADFPSRIEEAVASAKVVVALIGNRWTTIEDSQNRRRIDNPADWVRLEVASALEHGTWIVPVLVDDAKMPRETELPDPLRKLARHQAIELSDRHFDTDVEKLIEVLRERVQATGTQNLQPGYFRKLGTFHVHIDGDDQAHVDSLIGELGPNFSSKVRRITGESVPGPQRDDPDFDETYRYHTPGSPKNENFSIFSTTMLGEDSKLSFEAINALKHIIDVVTRKTGSVVELERVVATIDEDGVWTEVELISDPPDLWKLSDECEYPRLSTFPIEIHHAIDIPKKSSLPPLDLAKDMPKGPNIGGWFLFEKENAWAYRSNQFADWSDYEHYAKDGDARLRKFLAELHERGVEATLRTLVEQVLGIWRRDDELRRKDFKSVPDLARWEMTCPEFWVIAANFLGDKSPDVKNAMVQNLKRRVTYTYFVRSYADVFRLNMLRRELEDELRKRMPGTLLRESAREVVSKQIRCVLLSNIDSSVAQLLEPDYFICPRETDGRPAEGYQLQRGAIGGQKIDEDQVNSIIEGLSPLLRQKVEGCYLSLPQEPWRQSDYPERYAIVCTDVDSSEVAGGNKEWQRVLALYDRIVAREGSMCQYGDVVRPVRNGYLVVFKSVKDAAEFTKRLQSAVQWHNEASRKAGRGDKLPSHIVSLEYGLATRVLRAHGNDYIGSAIDKCISRLDLCKRERRNSIDGAIAVSDAFSASHEEELGEEPFPGRTRTAHEGWAMLV